MEEMYRFVPRIQSLFEAVEVMHLPIWMVGGLLSATDIRLDKWTYPLGRRDELPLPLGDDVW